MDTKALLLRIEQASQVVGTTWPLYSFVTSNPLSGYEAQPFHEACLRAYSKTGSITYPEISFFEDALKNDLITKNQLQHILDEHKFQGNLTQFYSKLVKLQQATHLNPSHKIDQILVKWLSVFLDEGLADWQMPDKHLGFYKAWASLAKYDQDLNLPKQEKLADSSLEVIEAFIKNLDDKEQIEVFENHLAALPGWVGYIKHRKENNAAWQNKFPIELADYLAVRILIAKYLGLDSLANTAPTHAYQDLLKIAHACLSEVEMAWQSKMANQLQLQNQTESTKRPDAQLVFCIDTRSELIRRNIESKGNYQTYGYAGFFGIAMDYEAPFTGITRKSCPPILGSAYKVTEKAKATQTETLRKLEKKQKLNSFTHYFLKRMKNILPSAFGFVEGAGLVYGYQLLKRTFGTQKKQKHDEASIENTCNTHMHTTAGQNELSLEEQTLIVKSAFDLMGWKGFAPLVIFAGHGSHTANNPFASSLDCGACAASPGRHNARMIAKLANLKEVRNALKNKHGITIPEDTLFLGAEHNTTTDEIMLFDTEAPKEFIAQITSLKKDLNKAQQTATAERLGEKNSVENAYKKSTDWSETRPEWGLAKNAGFIIGPRSLTQHTNLEGQCFLHSYDWKSDTDASALNGILNGPMVVTQWINNHYYFSTVDNNNFGSGSKITHNVVGKFGVVQGNGGDLKTGLPLQSLKQTDQESYHQPQRLSVYVNAPKERLNQLIKANAKIKELIDNQWVYLLVIDPTNDNKIERYAGNYTWKSIKKAAQPEKALA